MVELKISWLEAGCKRWWVKNDIVLSVESASLFTGDPKLAAIHAGAGNEDEDYKPVYDLNLRIKVNNPLPEVFQDTPIAILPDIPMMEKGTDEANTRRKVWEIIGVKSGLPFRAGLTVHQNRGSWSSTPHSFEKEALLSPKPIGFWEQFAYITNPAHGWGIQTRIGRIAGQMIDDIVTIGDRDMLSIPLGSHPVIAGPDYQLAYFWVYTADDITAVEKF